MEKSLTDVSPPHSHYEHSLPPGASLNAEVTNKNALESSNTKIQHELTTATKLDETTYLLGFNVRLAFEDFEAALDEIFQLIDTYSNNGKNVLVVQLGDFFDEKWDAILNKLDTSQHLFNKITSLSFADGELTLSNLKDLYSLFLKYQSTFPQISICHTPARYNIESFKDEFPDRKVKKYAQFLRRIGVKDADKEYFKKPKSETQALYIQYNAADDE